jgi:hypothetical protein
MGIISVIGTISDVANAITGSPVGLIINIASSLATVIITCASNGLDETSAIMYFNSNLKAAAPLPMQFKRVEVVESPGTTGKTVQEFTSSDDYGIWEPNYTIYSPKQRFAPWAYGLPKSTYVYDANGNIVKASSNVYSYGDILGGGSHGEPYIYKEKNSLNRRSCNCEVVKTYSQRNTQWSYPTIENPGYHKTSIADMKVDIYDMYTGRVELKSTTEKVYKPSSTEFLENKIEYQYNNTWNYEPNTIRSTQSNGDINEKKFTYSSDYFYTDPYNMFQQYNMVSLPVTTIVTVQNPLTFSASVLRETVTDYTMLSNGDIRPSCVMEQRFTTPQASIQPYMTSGAPSSRYKILQEFQYNNASLPIQIKDEGGRYIFNIYDYTDKYIVGTVSNATLADKSAYSSFETTGLGNWVLSGSAVYNPGVAITGSSSFSMSAGKSLSVSLLNTAKTYTVSFWATSSGINVTGNATLTKSAPTINGFTYYEYAIAQGTNTVTVAESGTLDELRLYPQTARMKTATYDPLIGQTSTCDENNRITYYEYDNLGRLRFIKDENRNNCPSGQTGTSITYTVPANTYSSGTSQAAADQLALNDIAANGQNYANTNGTCTSGCGSCTGNDKKCINNVCETGTWAVVSSIYKKVIVDGFLQWRWVCTYRYCFSDGTQSTYYEETVNTSSCTINCYAY